MKVKEQARKDLSEILLQCEDLTWLRRSEYIAHCMQERGWEIYQENLQETARDLGFPVVGTRIYGLDD